MKDEQLWKLFVRKPLCWFLRRSLPTEETDTTLAAVEALVIVAQGK
ncbi:hypothetical protein [Armatimonas sp.]